MSMNRLAFFGIACGLLWGAHAHALTAEQARALTVGETDARITALQQALASPDEKTAAFLQAMADDAVKLQGAQVLVVRDGQATDPVTGNTMALAEAAEDVINNNRGLAVAQPRRGQALSCSECFAQRARPDQAGHVGKSFGR
jgi:hypothetical protein